MFSALQAMALYNCGAKRMTNQEIVEFIKPFGYERDDFKKVSSSHNCDGNSVCCPGTKQCVNVKQGVKFRWEGVVCLAPKFKNKPKRELQLD